MPWKTHHPIQMVSGSLTACSPCWSTACSATAMPVFAPVCCICPRHPLILLFARGSCHSFPVCLLRKPRQTGLSLNSFHKPRPPRTPESSGCQQRVRHGVSGAASPHLSSSTPRTLPLETHPLLLTRSVTRASEMKQTTFLKFSRKEVDAK